MSDHTPDSFTAFFGRAARCCADACVPENSARSGASVERNVSCSGSGSATATERKGKGGTSQKWRATDLRGWRLSHPQYGAERRCRVCTQCAFRVLVGSLGEVSYPSGCTVTHDTPGTAFFFLQGPLHGWSDTFAEADGKRAAVRSDARNFTGVTLPPVGRDFPDTEICLRREPPHPRGGAADLRY